MNRITPAVLFRLLCFALTMSYLRADFPVLVEDAPDNSAGFAVFERAGLVPVPEEARPVRFIRDLEDASSHFFYSSSHQGSYSGWFWEEDDEIRLLRGNRMWEGPVHLGGGIGAARDAREGAVSIQPADLVQDTHRLFERWINHRERNFSTSTSAMETGNHMLLAVRLHQTGHTDAANQLAAHLFETVGRRETLLAALSAVQDLNYNDLFQDYLRDRDLEAFADKVEDMINRHRDSWLSAGIAEEAVSEWREYVSNPPGDPEGLDEPQSRLYNLLADMDDLTFLQRISGEVNWLLRPASQSLDELKMYGADSKTGTQIIRLIQQLGPETFPVLLALSENTRVLPVDSSQIRQSRSFSGSRQERELHELRRAFSRPIRVGELADQMLIAVNSEDFEDLSGEELREAARDFYGIIQGKSRLEIAEVYFEHTPDMDELDEAVIYTLLAQGGEEYVNTFRELYLEKIQTAHLYELGHVISPAPLRRGEDGKAFSEQAVAILQERFAEELEDGDRWEGRIIREQVNKLTKGDEDVTAGDAEVLESFDSLIDKILAGNINFGDDPLVFEKIISDPESMQRAFLERYGEIHNQSQRQMLGYFFHNMMYYAANPDMMTMTGYGQEDPFVYYENPETGAQPDSPDEEDLDPAASLLIADLWRPQLEQADQTRAFELAYWVIALGNTDEEIGVRLFTTLRQDTPRNNPNLVPVVLALAGDILDGKNPDWDSVLPDSGKVPSERAEVMNNILRGVDAEAALELLQTMDLNEIAWIQERLQRPAIRDNQALWEQLADPRRIVIELQEEDTLSLGESAPAEGDRLTMDHIIELLSLAQQFARDGHTGSLMFHERGIKPGLTLQNVVFPRELLENEKPGVKIILHGHQLMAQKLFSADEDIVLDAPDEEEETDDLLLMMGLQAGHGGKSLSEQINVWLEAETLPFGVQSVLAIQYIGTPQETTEP